MSGFDKSIMSRIEKAHNKYRAMYYQSSNDDEKNRIMSDWRKELTIIATDETYRIWE